jgi:integrase
MVTIEKRTGPKGVSYRVKIRRTGYPALTRSFESKTRAQQWARSIETKIDGDELIDTTEARTTTLVEALKRYRREVTPHKKGSRQEEPRIEAWKRASFAHKPLSRIRSSDITEWRDERLEAGVSGQTLRNDLSLLSHVFKIARSEWGMEGLRNPVDDVRRPKGNPPRERRLLPGEEDALLQHADTEWKSLIILAIETAMRRSELLGLRRADIDKAQGIARLADTKNSSPRNVPLSPRALAALDTLPQRLDGRIFGMDVNQHSLGWRALRKRAGVEGLRFHDLRHEGTSRLVESGLWNMAEIGSITGHRTLAMLARYYQPNVAEMAARMKRGAR